MATNPTPKIYLPYNTGNNISGNITVCSNLNNVFTLNVPTSCFGQLTWSVSNNMLITSQSGNSVTVTPSSIHTTEAGYISVKIENKDIEVKKYVWVGKPANNALSIQKSNGYTMYSNQWTTLTAIMPLTVMQDYTPYNDFTIEWNIPNSYINTFSNTTSKVNIKPYYNGSLNIGARAKNVCGCSAWSYRMFNVVPIPGTGGGGDNDELIYMGFN